MKKEFIPITRPFFTDDEALATKKAIASGWVSQGPLVSEFEKKFREYAKTDYALATSSCTTALHLALLCLGIGPGDEVIVPSYTFIATSNAVIYTGAKPVFADIDIGTYNLDSGAIGRVLTKKTKALIAVHQAGMPCDMDAITSLAAKKDISVLEDAACAIGSRYKKRPIGGIGDISCFSFHLRKVITTGEGGMIATKNRTVYKKARMLRSHGASISDLSRHSSKDVVFEAYPLLGYNYRMTDIQAAIGIEQLKKLDFVIKRRVEIAQRYINAFKDSEFIESPRIPCYAESNFQSFILRIKHNKAAAIRNKLMIYLLEKGIATRRGIMAVHTQPYYVKRFGRISLPVTEEAVKTTMIIPLFVQMSASQQDRVISEIKKGLKKYA